MSCWEGRGRRCNDGEVKERKGRQREGRRIRGLEDDRMEGRE